MEQFHSPWLQTQSSGFRDLKLDCFQISKNCLKAEYLSNLASSMSRIDLLFFFSHSSLLCWSLSNSSSVNQFSFCKYVLSTCNNDIQSIWAMQLSFCRLLKNVDEYWRCFLVVCFRDLLVFVVYMWTTLPALQQTQLKKWLIPSEQFQIVREHLAPAAIQFVKIKQMGLSSCTCTKMLNGGRLVEEHDGSTV